MDDTEALVELFRQHAKPYDPAALPGPRDIVLYDQADGPPRLFMGDVEYEYTADPSTDDAGFTLSLRRLRPE